MSATCCLTGASIRISCWISSGSLRIRALIPFVDSHMLRAGSSFRDTSTRLATRYPIRVFGAK